MCSRIQERKGTVADKAPNQVAPNIKEQRAKEMGELVAESRAEFLKLRSVLLSLCLLSDFATAILRVTQKNYTPVHIISDDEKPFAVRL